MKNIHILLLSVLFSLLIFSCQKGEQGEVGPAGIQGAKGATGDKGDAGITNSKGMITTAWFDAKPTDWLLSSGTTNNYTLSLTYASLTKDLLSKGNVYSYVQSSNSTSVYSLPYNDGVLSTMYSYIALSGTTYYVQYQIKYNTANVKPTLNYKLRSVFVPAAARLSADIDWENYEEVKKYLNLNCKCPQKTDILKLKKNL